jgi:hypothetical protein
VADDRKLVHYARLRASEDLPFLQGGMCDEIIVNANQLENSSESTAAHLRATGYRYMVDPVLWRFQMPGWLRNTQGDIKRNYRRLARLYADGTRIRMEDGHLLELVERNADWERLAANIVAYQKERLNQACQLDLLDSRLSTELRPSRCIAPALVAESSREDQINRLLVQASAAAAGGPVLAMVALPRERLRMSEIADFLETVPEAGVLGYLLWTPGVTEDYLITTHESLAALIVTIRTLARRGPPVIQVQLGYTAVALSSIGVAGVAQHLGWVDQGDPAHQSGGGPASCQTYVPGVRTTKRFEDAFRCGMGLDRRAYRDLYCECRFCAGVFEQGGHPLNVLLAHQAVRGQSRNMPTSQATAANTWHYLLSRRAEVLAFSAGMATDVIARDIERAGALAGQREAGRLQRLADELLAA